MSALFYLVGLAICFAVLLQLTLWTTAALVSLKHNRQQWEASQQRVKQQIESSRLARPKDQDSETWKGYREFFVSSMEKAADGITSVYFKPVDGKPIPSFQAGQHLPLKFNLPGEPRPLVRCYSLSTGPRRDFYRISVKAIPAPHGKTGVEPGRVSNFINSQLMVGDIVQAKPPSGSFVLNEHGNSPIVLLAGGIGITPVFSMLEELVAKNVNRTVVLLYGVRFGREHAFASQIRDIVRKNRNIHVVNCYSEPEETDGCKSDYQFKGWVNIDLIKRLMPNNQCMFYLCGPPPFMDSLHSGLLQWGVPENRIHFEAFGPATVKKVQTDEDKPNDNALGNIEFARQGKQLKWNAEYGSLLELAEANEIALESGCRAGSCKTCAIPLVEGKVQYPDAMDVECEAGHCLPCVAIPDGDITLDV